MSFARRVRHESARNALLQIASATSRHRSDQYASGVSSRPYWARRWASKMRMRVRVRSMTPSFYSAATIFVQVVMWMDSSSDSCCSVSLHSMSYTPCSSHSCVAHSFCSHMIMRFVDDW